MIICFQPPSKSIFNRHQSWEAIPPDTATFTPDISPLVLAAHTDNYEVNAIIVITIIIIVINIMYNLAPQLLSALHEYISL